MKVVVNLPNKSVEKVRQIAADRNVTLTEALRQIIMTQSYLHIETRLGSKVLIEKPNLEMFQVIFK